MDKQRSVRSRHSKLTNRSSNNTIFTEDIIIDNSARNNAGFKGSAFTSTSQNNNLSRNIAVFVAGFVIYGNTLKGGFLHDDNPAILRNPDVQGSRSLWRVFENDFWGTPMTSNASHKSYRPITILMFRVEHFVFGFDPFWFHFVNIFMHSMTSVFFSHICNRIIFQCMEKCQTMSLLCGILFALHPIHTEAVANVVGRAEIISSLFYLLSILCYDISLKKSIYTIRDFTAATHVGKSIGIGDKKPIKIMEIPKVHFISSLFLAACAMLSKETGITVLGIMVIINIITLRTVSLKIQHRKSWHIQRAIITVCWIILSLIFRLKMMDWKQPIFAEPDNPASQSPFFRTRTLTYLHLTLVNFKLLAFPLYLIYDWSYATVPLITTIPDIRNLFTLLFVFSFILISFYIMYIAWKEGKMTPLCYGLTLLVVPYIPISNLFFPVGFVVAERTLYLPSMGFIVLLVTMWNIIYVRCPKLRNTGKIVIFVIMLLYGARTWRRNFEWQTKESLFKSGVRDAPHNAKIRYNWGNYLRDTGRYKEAISEYEETLRLYPRYAGAMNNLATILEMNASTSSKAEELYVRLIRLEPGRVDAYKNLADLHMKKKRYNAAVDIYSRLFNEYGSHVTHVISFAELLHKHNLTEQAERLLARTLSQYCSVQSNKGIWGLLSKRQKLYQPSNCISNTDELHLVYTLYVQVAVKIHTIVELTILLEKAIEIQPTSKALILLGWLKYDLEDLEASETYLLKAAKLDKSATGQPWKLAEIYHKKGDLLSTENILRKILEIDGNRNNKELILQHASIMAEIENNNDTKKELNNNTVTEIQQ